MLTSLQIGHNGRLGNQMFQYATLAGVAVARGYEWQLQKDETVDLWKVFKMTNATILDKEIPLGLKFRYAEPYFHFNASIFLIDDDTDLQGYFQSMAYFNNCLELIREDFTFNDSISSKANSELTKYCDNRFICSVHVRRGDYLLKQNYHPPCTLEYYQTAKSVIMNAFNGNIKFLLFGDDHEWIRENLIDERSVLVEGNSPEVDLCMMSRCSAHIISNSSFSWWGSVLGNFRAVVAPRQWFGSEGPKQWDTIYVPGWAVV